MRKSNRNFLVDSVLIFTMSVSVITGLLVWFVYPFDSGSDEISMILEAIHKWSSATLVIVSVYHLITHWEWYKKAYQNLRR